MLTLFGATFFGVDLEKYVPSATICGIIMAVACIFCIIMATRDSMYEYKGKLIWGAIVLGLIGILQLLIGLSPDFQRWVISFLPV